MLATTLVAIRSQLGISAPPEVALEGLVAVEQHLRGTIPDDLLALLIATGQSLGSLCATLGDDEATISFWFLRKGEAWAPTFLVPGESPVVSYCRWKYPTVDFTARIDPALLAAFQPCVVAPSAAKERRVRHSKFGEGVVVQAIAPDKLEIDFGAHGVRKLLASAVEDT